MIKRADNVSYRFNAKEGWLSTEEGSHFLVGKDGKIKGGFGGKFTGKSVSKAFRKSGSKSESKSKSKPETKPESKPAEPSAINRSGHRIETEFLGGINPKEKFGKYADEMSKNLGRKVTEEEAKESWIAMRNFSTTESSSIRRAYTNPENASEEDKRMLKAVDTFIDGSPKWDGSPIYRGMGLSDEIINGYAPGKIIDMKGPASWSSGKGIATRFAKRASSYFKTRHTMFKLAKTNKAASITHVSAYGDGEKEVTSPSHAKYIIKKIEKGVDTVYIELEEVEDD